MFGSHVSKKLSPYWNGELAPEEAARVAGHVAKCDRCRRESEEVEAGARFARELGRCTAPDGIWAAIEVELDVLQARQSGGESEKATGGAGVHGASDGGLA